MKFQYSDKRTSVTVLIPLFAFSLTTHTVYPFYCLMLPDSQVEADMLIPNEVWNVYVDK